ncbi:hypothetical protein OEZ85_013779 [Tetradesmus obliquus]|uniref:Aminotransferase class V domain-containing protein n=1 Tax=Tetradesmus obliquus TaxID=3088 RepID=A0ABY8U623_TETOB|nr:hypothetical protein OEZ85_013779 [Tetradesmus obliquus]
MSKSNPLSAAAAAAAAPAALSDLQKAKASFLNSELSSSYGYQGWLEQHWWAEVGARFGPGQHYLDYTGAGQFTTSQLAAAFQELSTTGLGNPHSNNPSSAAATREVAAARALVLAHFNASAEEYHVIYTKGATEGLKMVHAKSDVHNQHFVLLDAAAYAATHALDMSAVQPDFLTVSFYKLFGYPSGLGALLVYFGGGSVSYCTAEDAWHVLSPAPAGYEDGTLGSLNIACLKHGFSQLAALGGMQAVSAHVESLRQWTYSQLLQLCHSNGQPLVRLFGRHAEGPRQQGGIFQFQVLTPEGDRVPGSLVDAAASAAGLHLRSGCNCNPGRCMANLGITPQQERERAAKFHKGPILIVMRPQGSNSSSSSSSSPEAIVRLAEQQQQDAGEPPLEAVPLPLGSVRVSLGAYSTFEDCYALVRLLGGTFTDFEVYQRELAAGMKLVRVMDDAEHAVKLRAAVALAQ